MAPPSPSRVAGWHLPVALALVGLGVAHLVLEGLQTLAVLRAAFPLALGGFVVLVVGTSRMLLAGTAGIPVAGRRVWWLPGLLTAVGSLGLHVAFGGRPSLLAPSAIAWGLGLGLHAGLLGFSLARARGGLQIVEGWPALLATIAALGYGLAAAVAVPSVALASFSLLAALHLVVTGFVVLAIAAVVLDVLPRFAGRELPNAWCAAIAVTLALGPMLLAEGFHRSAPLLRYGALVEGLGLALLGGGLVWLVLGSERERISFLLYAVAGVAVLVGTILGVGIVLGWVPRAQAAWHGAVNLLGFVGLVVLGAVIDLFAPALSPGAEPLAVHNRAVVGLAVVGTGGLMATPMLPGWAVRLALAAYAAAVGLHLAGSVARLTR